MTLLPLGDLIDIGAETLARIAAVANAIDVAPFRLIFDRVHDSGRTVALRPSEPLQGVCAFRRALATAFERHGVPVTPRHVFRPHITLAYRGGAPGEIAIDPISWLVEDIRLLESVVGATRHVEHGRWMFGGMDRAA